MSTQKSGTAARRAQQADRVACKARAAGSGENQAPPPAAYSERTGLRAKHGRQLELEKALSIFAQNFLITHFI